MFIFLVFCNVNIIIIIIIIIAFWKSISNISNILENVCFYMYKI